MNKIANLKIKIQQFISDTSPPFVYLILKSIKNYYAKDNLIYPYNYYFFNTANCQITKGNLMLGGVISYSSTNYKSENYGIPHTSYNLQIKPNVGYFFIDKLAAGIKTSIDKIGDKGGTSYTDFNAGPFCRYYILNSEKNVNIIAEGGYIYGFETGTASEKTSKNTFTLSAGSVVYFNTVVGLEFLISYSTYKFSGIKGSNNTIMFGLGLQVHLEKEK